MSSSNTTNTTGTQNKSAAQPVDYTQSPDYLKALESFNTQDFDNAYEHLRKELGAHPDNPYAHALMGKIAREKGNPDIFAQAFKAAIKLFEEQKNECEEYYDVATDLLDYAIFMPHSDESTRDHALAEKLANKRPTPQNHTMAGYLLDWRGHHKEAVEHYNKALTGNGEDDEVILCNFLYPSHLAAGDVDKAKAVLTEAESLGVYGLALRHAKAYDLDREGRLYDAIDICLDTAYRTRPDVGAAICEQDPRWENCLRGIAAADYSLVISKLEAFANEVDASPAVLRLAYDLSAFENAHDFFRIKKKMKAAGIEIGDVAPFYECSAYYHAGAFGKAHEAAEAAVQYIEKTNLENSPNEVFPRKQNITYLCSAALYLARSGNIAAAEAEFNNIKKIDPTNPDPYFWHTIALGSDPNDRFADIAKQAKAALTLFDEPMSYGTHMCLATLMTAHHRLGHTDQANAFAEKIIKMEDGHDFFMREPYDNGAPLYYPDLHTRQGEAELYAPLAYAILGKREEALKAIDHMLAVHPVQGQTLAANYSTAAAAYAILGMDNEAIESLGKALELLPAVVDILETDRAFTHLHERGDWKAMIAKAKAANAAMLSEISE